MTTAATSPGAVRARHGHDRRVVQRAGHGARHDRADRAAARRQARARRRGPWLIAPGRPPVSVGTYPEGTHHERPTALGGGATPVARARRPDRAYDVELVGREQELRRQRSAVDTISLRIPRASYCCLLGPSGCGKSTTLRMIAGHEPVSEGDILIGDRNVTDAPPIRAAPR